MNASVSLSPHARRQIEEIDAELQTLSEERADEFLHAINDRAQQLAQFPRSGATHRGTIRRLLLLNFPYSLFYTFDNTKNAVTVIACLHDRTNPRTWPR